VHSPLCHETFAGNKTIYFYTGNFHIFFRHSSLLNMEALHCCQTVLNMEALHCCQTVLNMEALHCCRTNI
jgi:hypothetical protein